MGTTMQNLNTITTRHSTGLLQSFHQQEWRLLLLLRQYLHHHHRQCQLHGSPSPRSTQLVSPQAAPTSTIQPPTRSHGTSQWLVPPVASLNRLLPLHSRLTSGRLKPTTRI